MHSIIIKTNHKIIVFLILMIIIKTQLLIYLKNYKELKNKIYKNRKVAKKELKFVKIN